MMSPLLSKLLKLFPNLPTCARAQILRCEIADVEKWLHSSTMSGDNKENPCIRISALLRRPQRAMLGKEKHMQYP